ncbi:MAG: FecR domain-containing protein [Elusimicrobia bacterium]|nr:FecR domain-containing protein [Elusimicrobiota bacterium]
MNRRYIGSLFAAVFWPAFLYAQMTLPGSGVSVPGKSAAAQPPSQAVLRQASGGVQIRKAGTPSWSDASAPMELFAGDKIRTSNRGLAEVAFADGSRVELEAGSILEVQELSPTRTELKLNLGVLKAFIEKLLSRQFQVRTPSAVCSVRGTAFRVQVFQDGRTLVELYHGLLAVQDRGGNAVLLNPNEKIQVDQSRMSQPQPLEQEGAAPAEREQEREALKQKMRREVALEMNKEQVQAAAAQEIKLAEYQSGKSLIDAFGNRVRLEQYILRPQPDQFKLVVLNERENRFDYFFYLGTFNKALPGNLSLALNQLSGTIGQAPEFWLTGFRTGRSNTIDSVRELATGGHPVDLNSNATTLDDVNVVFDPTLDEFRQLSEGESLYQTLFDTYEFSVNGVLKESWSPTDPLQAISMGGSGIQSYNTDITFLNKPAVSSSFPEGDLMHQQFFQSYNDGSWVRWDNYMVNDDGRIATLADFEGIRTGSDFKEQLLNWNFEQVVTAKEFNGRKIDIVVEPRILIQSGIIPSADRTAE